MPLTNQQKQAILANALGSAAGRKNLAKAMTDPLRVEMFYGCPYCGWCIIRRMGVKACKHCGTPMESFKPPPGAQVIVWNEQEADER